MLLFSLEQSRRAYRADFAFYIALIVGSGAVLLVPATSVSRTTTLFAALFGVASWTAIEYVLHRFLLHRLRPFQTWHERHHLRPRALICTPTIVSASLLFFLVYLPAIVLTDLWRGGAYTLGVLIGYLGYAITHHAIHHWHIDNAWLRRRKHWHAFHHGAGVGTCYGVTNDIWDRLFRSVPAEGARRGQRSES